MESELIRLLSTLGYPVYLQGGMLENISYPDSFFTFFNGDSSGASYYDNDENAIVWDFSINFYSNDPSIIHTKLMAAKALLKSAGWSTGGAGYTVMSDEPSHTGRGMRVYYRED